MHANVILFPPVAANCSNCRSLQLCVAHHFKANELRAFANYVTHLGPIKQGARIFRQGEQLKALYVIRTGSVKTYFDSADGCEQAVAFGFSGDLLGLDAVAHNRHPTSAVALESTAYCAIPYERVISLATKFPGLWQGMMGATATQAMAAHDHVLLLGQKSAPARLASFLLDLSGRYAARGFSKSEFNLSMSRQEIANYLAVAVETISRLFKELQRRGAIAVDCRLVKILSQVELRTLASEGDQLAQRTA